MATTARADIPVSRPGRRSIRRAIKASVGRVLIYVALIAVGATILLPFLWTLSSSLKPFGTGISFPPEFIPKRFEVENYVKVVQTIPFFRFLRNSVIVTGLSMLGELVSCSLVAYAFARLRFPGRNALFVVLLGTMMIPYPVTMVPTFILFNALGWVNTYLPLILPPFFGPAYNVFLLRQLHMVVAIH